MIRCWCVLFKTLLLTFLLLLFITILIIVLIKKRKEAIQVYSIQTFLSGSAYSVLENEPDEQKKSLVESINDFFKDNNENNDEGDDSDIGGDGDDAGE